MINDWEIGRKRLDIGFRDKAGKIAPPFPHQYHFSRDQQKHNLADGGYGSAKTSLIVLESIRHLVMYPDNLILYGRARLNHVKATLLDQFFQLCPKELVLGHDSQAHIITVKSKNPQLPSRIVYGSLANERDTYNFLQSVNLGAAFIDQLEQVDEQVFCGENGVTTRIRRVVTPEKKTYSTMNPNGHNWQWKRWIKNGGKKGYFHVSSSTFDNPTLSKDYLDDLRKLPPKLFRRLVEGSWDVASDRVYDDEVFSAEKNLITKPFEPPINWRIWRVADYGMAAPFCCLWIAVSPRINDKTGYNDIVVFREYYEKDLDIFSNLRGIHDIDKKYRSGRCLIDPTTNRRESTGEKLLDRINEFTKNREWDMFFEEADNNLMGGIFNVTQLLQVGALKFVADQVPETLTELVNYQMDIEKDAPKKYQQDHAMDCVRYFANDYRANNMIMEEKKPKDFNEWYFNVHQKEIIERGLDEDDEDSYSEHPTYGRSDF